jgi:hypothetical protein
MTFAEEMDYMIDEYMIEDYMIEEGEVVQFS